MSRDYTKLFIGSKAPADSQLSSGDSTWISDSLLEIQRFVNNTGRSAGVISNFVTPLSTDGTATDLPGEIVQWDYFQIVTKSTSAAVMTLRDPGIYLATANVAFTGLATAATLQIASLSTTGSVTDGIQASQDAVGGLPGETIFLNAVTQMLVTTVPATVKLQASVVPGSTTAKAQNGGWAITRLFPIPSNRG